MQRLIQPFAIFGCLLLLGSCLSESTNKGNDDGPLTPPETEEKVARLTAYEACEEDSECDGLSCVSLLGSKVCTQTGCKDGPACGEGETCIVSAAIDPTGVCARTGASDFCGVSCRDALACSLNVKCIQAGCCDEVGEDGCPKSCEELKAMECEIAPQCPASCCES